jgi:hypothetical protein
VSFDEPRTPKAGDVLWVTSTASVQFAVRPILFRVIRIHDRSTYDDWTWLDGYELDPAGDAVERRSIFVQPLGLIWVDRPGIRPPTTRNAGRNAGPAIPRPRTPSDITTTTTGRAR